MQHCTFLALQLKMWFQVSQFKKYKEDLKMKRNLQNAVLVVIGMITTAQVKGSELNLKSTDNSLIAAGNVT